MNANDSNKKKSVRRALMDRFARVMEFPFLFVPTQATASRQNNLFAKTGNMTALKILVL
jgi:hypothetical protein